VISDGQRGTREPFSQGLRLERVGDQLPELAGSGAERNGAGEIHDQDVPYFPVKMFEGHGATVAPRGYECQQPNPIALLCVGNSRMASYVD
jgi:hypothetical protein